MKNSLEHTDHKNATMVDYVSSMKKMTTMSDEAKFEKETIHSGQFMISHFEAEEAMDDLDDSEIKMLDPEDPSLMKPGEANVCLQIQLYDHRNTTQIQKAPKLMGGAVTSHLEIETSLTKLFKCMTLAYSQKLTSPKWNHFKGVRLRWKDKIRLNNVIWRCWHMQFILKRKTPVCQFASPLDTDVHSNPQSVVLEGKYWKRQLTVIKAEYRKWRRNYISKTTGLLSYDSKSDFDFLEWSPLNGKNLFPSDEWTSDILFSSINVPFPFPDPREIARGAGIADFIQPSLGPLQPNIDDIDLTFADFFQCSRLPPVPEEVSDEMFKNVECAFPAIMGPDQMEDSSTVLEVDTRNIHQNNDDANMIELNNSLNTQQFNDVGQQFETRVVNYLNEPTVIESVISGNDTVMIDQRIETQQSMSTSTKHFGTINDVLYNRNVHEFPGKSIIKGRISKNVQRPFRRELHNYDKAQPTPHQTSIYQQMLAEQQKKDNSNFISLSKNIKQHKQSQLQTTINKQLLFEQQKKDNSQHLSLNINIQEHKSAPCQQSLHMQYRTPQNIQKDSQTVLNCKMSNSDNSQIAAIGHNNSSDLPSYNGSNYLKKFESTEFMTNTKTQKLSTSQTIISEKLETVSSEKQIKSSYEFYCNNNSSDTHGLSFYKPTQVKSNEKSFFVDSYQRLRDDIKDKSLSQPQVEFNSQTLQHCLNSLKPKSISPSLTISSQEKNQQNKKLDSQKEIFRSNSLPLNVSLKSVNHDNFVAPKHLIKSNKPRSRSNSIHQHVISNHLGNLLQMPKELQPAASEPQLQSTLTQLLTTPKNIIEKQSSSDNNLSKFGLPLIGPELQTKESIATCKSSAIAGIIPNSAMKQQYSQAQLHQPILKLQTDRDLSAPMTGALLLYEPRENHIHNPSVASDMISSEPLANQIVVNLTDQNRMISTESQRRVGHIHAEQKRRYNIKNGFDMLHSLIPHLKQNVSAKLSKAAMLQKGAEHIIFLQSDIRVLDETIKKLEKERDALNSSLSHLQAILPANGAPLARQGSEHVMDLYEHFVRYRTLSNWKFWILGLIMEPLLTTFTSSVSCTSLEEMQRTAYLWIDQHCSLIDLRPAVSNKLKYLSMNTDILSNPPSTLHEEVKKAINLASAQHLNLHG